MILFNCDYTEGAHPNIMKMLNDTNFNQTVGYGEDEICYEARTLIKNKCNREDVDVHFLVGGTQTNATFIASALRPHQGVISAKTGHINVHETGAIEATGHKVIALDCGKDGKLNAKQIDECYLNHVNDSTFEHMVQPKMVYISNSTENGSVYTKAELTAISDVCRKNGMILYLDGARLGYALTSPKSDITLEDLCDLCDAFYIGGTKVGALFGEALIIVSEYLKTDFRYFIKQNGGMLAKGRLLGIQFLTLFTDDLYFKIAGKATNQALSLAKELKKLGVDFHCETESNQLFPIFDNELIKELDKKYVTAFWEKHSDAKSVIRICTSWATTDENIAKILADIKDLLVK